MKLFKDLHPLDLDCIYERLNDLSFRIWKLEQCNKPNTEDFDNLEFIVKPIYKKKGGVLKHG